MTTRIQLRRGTAAQWTDADPVLALGEAGIETDTLLWKVGDGVTIWSELPYMESANENFGNVTVTGNAVVGNLLTDNYLYANGAPVVFGASTGNITFNGTTMSGPTGAVDGYSVYIQPSADFTNTLQILPTADNDIHLFEKSGNAITLGAYGQSQITVNGPASANANITVQANGNAWTFGTDGNLTFPENSGQGWPINTQRFGMGNIGAWLDGQWTIGEFSGNGVSGTVGIRIDPAIEGYTGITLPGSESSNTQPVQIYSTNGGGIELYTGGNNWTFNADGSLQPPTQASNQRTGSGLTLKIGDTNSQAIITGPAPVEGSYDNAPRLVIAGQDGVNAGEGGDIYLWAGRSGPNVGGQGGGDIKIDAGEAINGAEGGTIKIRGGYSGAGAGGFVEIYAGDGGYGAPVDIRSGQGNSQANSANITLNTPYGGNWQFDNSGNLTLPSNVSSINYANGQPYGGSGGADIGNWVFDANDATVNNSGYPRLFGGPNGGPEFTFLEEAGNNASYSQTMYINNEDGFFVSLDYGNSQFNFATNGNTYLPGNIITGGETGNITGANVISANTFTIAGNTTLNQVEGANTAGFYNADPIEFLFELGPNTWNFNGNTGGTGFPTLSTQRGDNPSGTITGQTLLFGDSTQEAIISTPNGTSSYNSSQRLVINPGEGYPGSGGEGGDIYLWAGRGGDASGSGGDIKIRGGQGGANTSGGNGGDGGYIRIEAGDAASTGGAAGYIQLTGGTSNAVGGYVTITGGSGQTQGGDANINGGYTNSGPGGRVNINGGGSGSGLSQYGNVNIVSGASTWTFDNTGLLSAPGAVSAVGNITAGNITTGGIANLYSVRMSQSISWPDYNGSEIYEDGGLVINGPGGVFVTGNVAAQFEFNDGVGNSSGLYSDANSSILYGNTYTIVRSNNAGGGGYRDWTFGVDGNLTIPGGGGVWTIAQGTTGLTANILDPYRVNLGLDYTANTATLNANNSVYIQTNSGNTQWAFGADGNLTVPGAISAVGDITGASFNTTGTGGDIVMSGGDVTGARRVITTPTALANLTAVAGGRAFANDANLVAVGNFGAIVGNGGANTVPVWSDGENWYIG